MYHEEQVIDGVLCWRGAPDGEWTQYTAEALTVALIAERGRTKELEEAERERDRWYGYCDPSDMYPEDLLAWEQQNPGWLERQSPKEER